MNTTEIKGSAIAEEIKNRIGDDVEVTFTSVQKNNGIKRNGFTITKAGCSVSPNIYYDELMTDEEIVDHVVSVYEHEVNVKGKPDIGSLTKEIFSSPESIYKNIVPVLVNRDRNAEFLQDVVHRPFLDMEIIYKVKIASGSEVGVMTTTIKNDMVDKLDLDVEELHESAINNIRDHGMVVGMIEMIKAMSSDPLISEMEIPGEEQMYIATNEEKVNGASVILLEDVMQKLHDKLNADDVVILPSSIHEVIGVKADMTDKEQFKSMVNEVNTTQVSDEEVLSNSIYIHSRNGEWRVV